MHRFDQDHLKSLNILLTDDSVSERTLLKTMLEKHGHHIIEAISGEHAIYIIKDNPHHIDLILLDVRMPGINGIETAKKIRQIETEQGREWHPIIFLSSQNSITCITNAIYAGGDDYLTKPVDRQILNAKIVAMQRIADMRRRLIHTQQKLENQANTDELTQLPNRRHFLSILDSEMARVKRHNSTLSIAYMDIDFFKQINDEYGHETGDLVLSSIAKVLTDNLRHEDSVARIGGEEFCICLPGADSENSLEPCERYRSLIEELEITTDGQQLNITASFGLTSYNPATDDKNSLLARADKALYQAKEQGRNRVVVLNQ